MDAPSELPKAHIGVVGASSLVGRAVAAILHGGPYSPILFSREARDEPGMTWRRLAIDIVSAPIPWWIDLGHVWTFDERRDAIKASGARKIVITSSTSRFTKSNSGSEAEVETARKLAEGEVAFSSWCEANGIEWVILRPTLIYGHGRDKNISEMARIITRSGIFPIFGEGSGKRQPIHADDLAHACVLALQSTVANKSYNLTGGEVVIYREMVRRVFAALGRRPIMPSVPLPIFRAALLMLNRIPRFAKWSPQMAERMNADMVFDHSEATRDFGFQPRPFTLLRSDVTGSGNP